MIRHGTAISPGTCTQFGIDHEALSLFILGPVTQVSSQYGNPAIWPGDTFGISALKRWNGPGAPEHVALSWGSAVDGSPNSEIYATVMGR